MEGTHGLAELEQRINALQWQCNKPRREFLIPIDKLLVCAMCSAYAIWNDEAEPFQRITCAIAFGGGYTLCRQLSG
jgi:hypothetical protein